MELADWSTSLVMKGSLVRIRASNFAPTDVPGSRSRSAVGLIASQDGKWHDVD
jgi:hypothetical protein